MRMILIFNLPTYGIILIAVAAVILLVVLTILIQKWISRKKLNKKMDLLLKEIESEQKIPLENNLKRLNNIANNNEAYVNIYKETMEKFNELFNERRDHLSNWHHGLIDRISKEKITKKLLVQVRKLQDAIRIFQMDISTLQNHLDEIFKAGDNLRVRSTDLKEKFRIVNLDMEKYFPSLTICYDNLKTYVDDIEMLFDLFESNMSGAKYPEASKKLDDIEKRILPLYGNIEKIAQYNDIVLRILPDKLKELLDKNNEFEAEGYVVSHAKVKEFIANTQIILKQCESNFKKLSFGEFEEIVQEIYEKIDQVNLKLDQEVESKRSLEANYEPISEKIKTVETNFIKTKRHYTNMKEYYILPTEITDRFQLFEANATSLSDLKREYEGYIFVNTMNPASFMLEKLNVMDEKADDIIAEMNYFSSYFSNVKQMVESTYQNIDAISSDLIVALGMVRFNKCHSIYERYRSVIDSCLSELKNISTLLLEKPINITYIEKRYGPLINNVSETKNRMLNEMNTYLLVEKSMVFANPLRCQFTEADRLLTEAEQCFNQENYKEAQEKINYVLNNYHPAGYDNFSGNQG